MRVLHLVKTSVGGSWALRQMRELYAQGIDVHVAVPADGPMVSLYRAAGITVHERQYDFPVKCPWRWNSMARSLRELVDEVAPDIIHSHFVGTTLTMRVALGKSHKVPRIFQVPGPLHLEHAPFRRLDVDTAGTSDWWVGSCRWTIERLLQSGVSRERVFLSYYGTDVERFANLQKGRLRQALSIGGDIPIVGMVAFMYPPRWYLGQQRGLKGHEDLIDAMVICRNKGISVLCVFVGGAWGGAEWYEQRVRKYAADRCPEGVLFMGTRNDAVDLLPDFNVLVVPSHSENVGGAVEALLAGVPTVATTVGGLPDLVEHSKTGWLVPPKNPERIASAIIWTLENETSALEWAKRGQERARAMFDCRRTACEVMKIYEMVRKDAEKMPGR